MNLNSSGLPCRPRHTMPDDPEPAGDDLTSGPEPDMPSVNSAGASLRVLIAEDDAVSQLVAAGIVESLGHAAAVAENGREALDMLARERFDLVIMDVRMPVMDGLEATRAIRAQPPPGVDPRLPIVALTAYARQEDRARIMAAGMDAFLSKPLHSEELRRIIEDLAARKRFVGQSQGRPERLSKANP